MENIEVNLSPKIKAITFVKGSAPTTCECQIKSSDDVPLFIYTEKGEKIALKIGPSEIDNPTIAKALNGLVNENALAYIGPSLGFSHRNIDPEKAKAISSTHYRAAVKRTDGVYFYDLPLLVYLELIDLGLKNENIVVSPYDTFENPDLLYSKARGDGEENITIFTERE